MLKLLAPALSVLSALAAGPVMAQSQDGPIVTGNRSAESADALKTREASLWAPAAARGAQRRLSVGGVVRRAGQRSC